jgi:hypothetical protein
MSRSYQDVDPRLLWCLGCFALGVGAIGLPVLRNKGFPLDDSWIHQVVGRNAADLGTPGFVAGSASSGSSSALWPWIIALNYRVLPWLAPVAYLFIFNCCCLLAVIVTLYRSAVADQLPKLEAALLGSLPALTGNFVWLAATGMEHLLLIAATFSAAYFWFPQRSSRPVARAVMAGSACGIAIITRPEAVAFVPLFVAAAWPIRKTRRELMAFLGPCAFALSLVLINNEWTSHSLLPVTYSGRKWLYLREAGDGRVGMAWHLIREWFRRVIRYVCGLDTPDPLSAGLMGVLLVTGLLRLLRRGAFRTLFLVLLAATNFAVYCLMLPVPGHGMRYLAMSLVFVFPLIALGALDIVERINHRAGTATAVAVWVFSVASLYNWMKITDAGIKHINNTHVLMGHWLNENLPQNTTVASFDIGGIGYFGTGSIIDLGGLVDTRSLSYLTRGRTADFLRERQVRYIVLPFGDEEGDVSGTSCVSLVEALGLCDNERMRKRAIVEFSSPRALWKRGYLPTGHAAQRQILFELTWPAG